MAAKRKVVIGYYEKKTDALEALERLSGKDLSERYNMTFSQVYEEWKEEHFKEIGESGIESYENAYRVFASIHNRKFRDLRTKDFQEIIDKNLGKSYSTLSKYKQLLTQMSSWAVREELMTSGFAKFVKLPENQKKEKEIFTQQEIEKLTRDGSEASQVVLMLIYTGMRINELFTLELENYHNSYAVGGEKTEAGKNRIIPIPQRVRGYFSDFAKHADGPLLISGYSGQHLAKNFRRRDYYPLLDKLGIQRKSPHCTRHTFASMARKNGVHPETLQKILGHADYSTTANIYYHESSDELIHAVENL